MIKTYISALLMMLLALTPSAYSQQEMDDLLSQMDSADAAAKKGDPSAADGKDPGAASEVDMLSSLFERGVAYYEKGNFAEAVMIFDSVLTVDKYHAGAISYKQRAAERVAVREERKTSVVRARAIAEVNEAWNPPPVPMEVLDAAEDAMMEDGNHAVLAGMEARLKAITIPVFDVSEATIQEVVQFFAETSRSQSGPGEDIDILLVGMDTSTAGNNITISVDDMSLYEALQYVVEMASLKFEIVQNLVVIMPVNYVPATKMVMRSYDIIPEVGADMTSAMDSGGGADDLFGASSGGTAAGPVDVAGFFTLVGFPEGASAVYHSRFNKLFVSNTPKNIRAIEAVLDDLSEKAIQRRSQQVAIEAKFVEFSEGALEELGFDWTVYGSGSVAGMEMAPGTYQQKALGYTTAVPVADGSGGLTGSLYTDPVNGQRTIDAPNKADGTPRPGENLFGSAQRDNTTAFDELGSGLLSTMGGPASAMVLSNGDVDLRISAMEQEGTADVLSAPKVTAKSGTEALIRVAETHRYPQDYDVTTGQRTAPVVRPQDWQDFDMGVSLRVTPVVDSENETIALTLLPEIVVFKGYEDYIVGFNAYDGGGNDAPARAGDGRPFLTKMPFFDRRLVETQVTIADGSTVVMGGLVDEQTESFRDQVPFLGDIPYLGRLFRTEGSRFVRKNLTIFVKASQVDARGLTRADRELARF